MKRVLILTMFVTVFSSAFAQTELIARIERQAVEIDSLKKVVNAERDKIQLQKVVNENLEDTINKQRSELKKLKEFKTSKDQFDNLLKQQRDSIDLLKHTIVRKDSLMIRQRDSLNSLALSEYKRGKSESIATIINSYNHKPFDELLKSSTPFSVQRDFMLLENQMVDKKSLNDLKKYFLLKGLLESKSDPIQNNKAIEQLSQIKQESVMLANLTELVDNYQALSDGLKKMLDKINELDKVEIVSQGPSEIQKKKLNKILGEISSYVFNYDYNFSDYPYLSDVLFQLIKRKQPNADADISDLIKKL